MCLPCFVLLMAGEIERNVVTFIGTSAGNLFQVKKPEDSEMFVALQLVSL